MAKRNAAEATTMRLDKWLWCARFFKTRALAASAIRTGKVLVDDNRPKPAKTIATGAELTIRRGPYEYNIRVDALSQQRLGAAAAAGLYTESAASIRARQELAEQMKLEAAARPRPPRRPDKRERRQIIRFNQKNRES